MALKKKATAKKVVEEIKKEIKPTLKTKYIVVKGFGEKFGAEKIVDGSELNLPIDTAKPLLKKGFIKIK